MIENLEKNTGKSLEQWIKMVRDKSFSKHGEIMDFLKKEQGLTHGFANLVAHKSKENPSLSEDTLINEQYENKPHLKHIMTN